MCLSVTVYNTVQYGTEKKTAVFPEPRKTQTKLCFEKKKADLWGGLLITMATHITDFNRHETSLVLGKMLH